MKGEMHVVSGLTMVFSVITLFLSLVFPVLLAIWFCRKYKAPATTVLLGALTFLVFQWILRIPLLRILQPYYPGAESNLKGWGLALYSFYLAFTAALFEEGGRVIVCKLFLKKKKSWNNAIALGIGHGGFESISIVGLTYINNLILMAIINLGFLNPANDPTGALSQAVQLLTNTPPVMFLLAGVERVLAIILHIGFSLLVVYGLASRKLCYVLYAFLAHFILNFPLAFTQGITGGTYITMAYIAIMALVSLYWSVKISPALFEKLQLNQNKERQLDIQANDVSEGQLREDNKGRAE
ncbi:MAG: YhfC family intramembrane metalloprotease [Caldicoprobacterales bacterium]|nr:YhfC family intramembrane metalloprotease [Clostridiales bacterium]